MPFLGTVETVSDFILGGSKITADGVFSHEIKGRSKGRSGGLVFPSISEFSTVYCDPHSQRLWLVNKAEIDVFLELSCFFDDPADVGNLISGSSVFSKSSLNT